MATTSTPAGTGPRQLEEATGRLRRARRALDQQVGQARMVAETGRVVAAEVNALQAGIDTLDRAAAVLTSIADERTGQAQATIETLVTQGLRTIFGQDLSFHIVAGVRAKTPVVEFVVRSELDGTVVDTDVLEGRGGGLAATVGFLLRLVVLLLSPDKQGAPLLLDETFGHLSADYEPRLVEFLRQLVDATGVQIILVTHSEAYLDAADLRYRFRLVDGITEVAQI